MRRSVLSLLAAVTAIGAVLAAAEKPGPDPDALAREGANLYRKGAYAEALKKFEAAMDAGKVTAEILYRTGSCYGFAMGNKEKERELKQKAVPLLEKETAGPSGSLASYYYLASILINDLQDPAKGTEVARRGIAVVESATGSPQGPLENIFRAGRLYSFLGKDEKAVEHYDRFVKDAAKQPDAVDQAAVKFAMDSAGAHHMRKGEYEAAKAIYEKLHAKDPANDGYRHQLGLAMLRTGQPLEAVQLWRQAVSQDYRTELAYLAKVVERYDERGRPTTSKSVPDARSLDDETLAQKIAEVARTLAGIRGKYEQEEKAKRDKALADLRAEAEAKRNLPPEEVKARVRKLIEERKARKEADPDAEDPAGGTSERALKKMGLRSNSEPVEERPATPEQVAAEKEFFYLMTEFVARGYLIRNFSFQNGLVNLIFR